MLDINFNVDANVDLSESTGSSLLETGLYKAVVKHVYITQSKSGTGIANVILTIDNKDVKVEPLYISYADTKSPVRDGKVIPGFITINALSELVTGKPFSETVKNAQKKALMLYDFESKADKPTEVPVVVELSGKQVGVGITKLHKHKKKEVNGKWYPTTDMFYVNEIHRFYDVTTGQTSTEKKKGAEASFGKSWVEKNKGVTKEETVKETIIPGDAPATPAPTAKAVDALF